MLCLAAKHSRPPWGPSGERPRVSVPGERRTASGGGVYVPGEARLRARACLRRLRQELVGDAAEIDIEVSAQDVAEQRAEMLRELFHE